jgi:hypothetical protein
MLLSLTFPSINIAWNRGSDDGSVVGDVYLVFVAEVAVSFQDTGGSRHETMMPYIFFSDVGPSSNSLNHMEKFRYNPAPEVRAAPKIGDVDAQKLRSGLQTCF